jgi:hypothetical protein
MTSCHSQENPEGSPPRHLNNRQFRRLAALGAESLEGDAREAVVIGLQQLIINNGAGEMLNRLGDDIDDHDLNGDDDDDENDPDYEPSDAETEDSVEPAAGHDVGGYYQLAMNHPLHLHESVDHNSRHCPPFPDIDTTLPLEHVCDCFDYPMPQCCITDKCLWISQHWRKSMPLLFIEANENQNDRLLENNQMRFRLYAKGYKRLDFGGGEAGVRHKLPNCYVAMVRQLYPSSTGNYVGFKPEALVH